MFEFIFLFWGTQCWCHVGPAKKSYASCEDKLGHLNPGSLIYIYIYRYKHHQWWFGTGIFFQEMVLWDIKVKFQGCNSLEVKSEGSVTLVKVYWTWVPKIHAQNYWAIWTYQWVKHGWLDNHLLSQWPTGFKLLGITYLVGKIEFELFFHGPLAK